MILIYLDIPGKITAVHTSEYVGHLVFTPNAHHSSSEVRRSPKIKTGIRNVNSQPYITLLDSTVKWEDQKMGCIRSIYRSILYNQLDPFGGLGLKV